MAVKSLATLYCLIIFVASYCTDAVPLSVTFVCYVKTSKPILIFFLIRQPQDSSFACQAMWQYFDGNPLTGTKFAIFDQYIDLGSMIVQVLSVVDSFYGTKQKRLFRGKTIATRRRVSCLWPMTLTSLPKKTVQNLLVHTGKVEASKKTSPIHFTVVANYGQTRSIVRSLCNSKASCPTLIHMIHPYIALCGLNSTST